MDGEALKQWRTERGMTIAQLSEALDVASATISRWENGKRKLSPLLWRALEHLDCTTRHPPPKER